MTRTIEDIQKDIELLGIKGGYDVEQLLTPQDCRRLSYEIKRLKNIINEIEKERCNLHNSNGLLENAIDTLQDRNKEIYEGFMTTTEELCEATKEIERLNNIINELENLIKEDIITNLCEIENKRIGYGQNETDKIWLHNLWGFKKYIINRCDEILKGSDKND